MSLIHEAVDAKRLPKVADQLRERYAELIDTYGERLSYGHNLPRGIRGAARFMRSLMLSLSPNPSHLPLADRLDRAQVSLTAQFGGEEVTFGAISEYASAKDSSWIRVGVIGADELLVLRKNDKPKIEFLDTLVPLALEPSLTYLTKYNTVYRELKIGLEVKSILSS